MAENKPTTSLAAAKKREMRLVDPEEKENFALEFRSFDDEAWYTVMVTMEDDGTLRVRFEKSVNEADQLFEPTFFGSLEDLQDFEKRFRPLSVQVQDHECDMLVPGVKVCACQHFGPDDLWFYDAVVDSVEKCKHSCRKNTKCLCIFRLSWLHGPNVGQSTVAEIGDICIIQPILQVDPVVASFLEIARWRLELQSEQEMVETKNRKEKSNANRRAKRSVVRACSPEVNLEGTMEDMKVEGKRNVCMILIGNLDKELCPSTTVEFLYQHTQVTTSVFIFPSLSSETFTRGAIMMHTENDLEKLGDFLENPNHMITSSTGRPWFVIEKQVGLENIKASIGTLLPESEDALQDGSNRKSNNLKIVNSGTREFEIASCRRDLFLEFAEHQVRLHKSLATMEGEIYIPEF